MLEEARPGQTEPSTWEGGPAGMINDRGEIFANSLSAISANMGDITAGNLRIGNSKKDNFWMDRGTTILNDGVIRTNAIEIRSNRSTWGVDPININDKFIVDPDGNVTAKNGSFSGRIEAASGWFKGEVEVGNLRHNGWWSGTGTVIASDGCIRTNRIEIRTNRSNWGYNPININEKFIVTPDGNVTAKDGNFSGHITATGGSISGWLVMGDNSNGVILKGNERRIDVLENNVVKVRLGQL